MKAYDRIIRESGSGTSSREVCRRVANAPAPRYYVTARRAIEVVWRIHNGKPMNRQRSLRGDMYADIYKRALAMMKDTGRGLANCVSRIIEKPAPSFYVSPGTVRNIVSQVMSEKRRINREARRNK